MKARCRSISNFAPSVYRPTTGAIYISWGYMPQFAEVVIEPEPEAGFVSPTQVPEPAPAEPDGQPERQRHHLAVGSQPPSSGLAAARLLMPTAGELDRFPVRVEIHRGQ